jgi:hypothetical protein
VVVEMPTGSYGSTAGAATATISDEQGRPARLGGASGVGAPGLPPTMEGIGMTTRSFGVSSGGDPGEFLIGERDEWSV